MLFRSGSNSGASLEKKWQAYADSLARKLGGDLLDPDSTAERITEPGKYGRVFNLAPVISPDGTKILYYSSRGFHNELFIAEQRKGVWVKRSLIVGEETPEMESLPLLSASADWSPTSIASTRFPQRSCFFIAWRSPAITASSGSWRRG